MNVEDIKATMENLETGVFDRTTGTKELFLPMFEYLLSIIEQAEKAFEEINYQFELHEHEIVDNAIKNVDDIATEALQAIRKGD